MESLIDSHEIYYKIGVAFFHKGDLDKAPKNCPGLDENIEDMKEIYKEEENYRIAKAYKG